MVENLAVPNRSKRKHTNPMNTQTDTKTRQSKKYCFDCVSVIDPSVIFEVSGDSVDDAAHEALGVLGYWIAQKPEIGQKTKKNLNNLRK